MSEYLKRVIDKLLSGRYYQTVVFTTTYCLVILGLCVMTIRKIIDAATFLGVFAGFTTMVVLINEWYFKREDRKDKEQ